MKKIFFAVAVILMFAMTTTSFAQINKSIMTDEQSYVIMGSVKDITDESVIITVDHVLGTNDTELVGTDIIVEKFSYSYCDYHSPAIFNSPIVSDNIIISIDKNDENYVIKNGAYKIDSNERASCKIIKHIDETNSECIKALAEITCFIRSDAQVTEFNYDADGNIFAVYPQSVDQCVQTIDNDGKNILQNVPEETIPDTNPIEETHHEEKTEKDLMWVYALAVFVTGAVLGLVAAYIFTMKKSRM